MTKDLGRFGILTSTFLTLVLLAFAPATVGATLYVPPTNQPKTYTPPGSHTGIASQNGTIYPDPHPPVSGNFQPTPEPAVSPQQTKTEVNYFQQQGQNYLNQLRNTHIPPQGKSLTKTQLIQQRQKKCEQLQFMLNRQISEFSKNAQTHLATFNTVFTKVQAYATSAKISSLHYTNLVTTANTQEADATQAVDALKSVAVSINCTQTDPASVLATIRSAVDSSRTTL